MFPYNATLSTFHPIDRFSNKDTGEPHLKRINERLPTFLTHYDITAALFHVNTFNA